MKPLKALAWLVALARHRDQLRSWTITAAASVALTLATPLGPGLWEFALGTVFRSHPAYRLISEWQPIKLSSADSLAWLLLVGLIGLAVWKARATWRSHRDWTVLLCAAAFIAMSIQSSRHSSFVALLAPLLLTRPFSQAPAAKASPAAGRLNQATALVLAIGALALVGTVWNQPPSSAAGSRPIRRASAAIQSVAFTLPGVPDRRPCMESSAKA